MRTTARIQGYKKSDLARYSLFFMLLLPCFLPAKVGSVVLLAIFFIWLTISRLHIGKGFFALVSPFLILLAIGSAGVVFYPPMDVVKDIWYVGGVVATIGAGFVLARFVSDLSKVLRVVVLAGAIAAVVHFIEVALYWETGKSFFDLRSDEGVRGYFITVIGAALLVSMPRRLLDVSQTSYYIISTVSLLSLLFAFSRTYLVVFLIMVVILKGWAKVNVVNFTKVAIVIGLVVLGILFLAQSDNSEEKSLSDKFINSVDEVLFRDYSEMRDINQHWRGFESYRAMKDFQDGSVFEKIFGQGLGATVDLGFYMQLGGNEFRYIPVLHNGYMYVLVKFGLIGLLLYLVFIFKLITAITYLRKSNACSNDELLASRIVAAMGWSLLLTTFVIAGAFNNSTMLSSLLLLGLCVGLVHRYRVRECVTFRELKTSSRC